MDLSIICTECVMSTGNARGVAFSAGSHEFRAIATASHAGAMS
jgi:hypothetical protein